VDNFGDHWDNKMNVVHIVFEAPKAIGSGAVLRNYAITLSLSRLGRSSTIVVQEYYKIGKKHPPRESSFVEAKLAPEVIADVVHRVKEAKADLVVVDGIYLADIARALSACDHQVVLDMHNIESALLKETDISRKGWHAKLFYRSRWARAERAEADIANWIGGAWVCSKEDVARMTSIASRPFPIEIVQNPIPAWCHNVVPVERPTGIRSLFVGHLGYQPNIRAVERLVQHIHPAILQASPNAHLDICGRAPGKKLRMLAESSANTRLLADPDELGPIYAEATVAVIPLNDGGGTRLKVLEALALGLPIVATAKAVEGLNLVPDHTYLEAETNSEFATAVNRLANAPDLRQKITHSGQKFVLEHHGDAAMDRAVAAAIRLKG
jgi:glycosyltransferase involved in cell wall biosynthesis